MTKVVFQKELEECVRKNGCAYYEMGDYSFRFGCGKDDSEYKWKGRRLRITPCEALYLYQRLVMGLPACMTRNPNAISKMRHRYGDSFLCGMLGDTRHNKKKVEEKQADMLRLSDDGLKIDRKKRKDRTHIAWDWADGYWAKRERECFEEARRQGRAMQRQTEAGEVTPGKT
jgi:hypothetical protein